MNKIHFQINELYLDLAKGAFIRSRAKWLEDGERNSSYFFALEKRKSLSALNIDGAVCKDIVQISNFVSNLYSSKLDTNSCDSFLDKVQCCIPAIDDDYKSYCELKCEEVWKALQSMKKGKSPGIDGLSVEFYTHFWDTIKSPLVKMYKECIIRREMTVTMKQGIIYLIPKANKDILSIDNWRLITLLTVDYKVLALVYANRLKTSLDFIISETQSGFLKGRHISNNIRLVLDLLDYADSVHSNSLILFLDFYKAFDTIEHQFLLKSLKLFGFGDASVDTIAKFYNEINSSVVIHFNTSNRFDILCGVRQGCPISPFLFLLVKELLSLSIVQNQELEGISVLGREMKISQLADDTTLFLKDESQVSKALDLIYNVSCASGLKLNVSKCEIMPVHDLNNDSIENIPIKSTVKYLGIYITKNLLARQHLNFSSRIVKSKNIIDSRLRDLTLYGRVILSKAEGLSHFVYPSISLFVENKVSK